MDKKTAASQDDTQLQQSLLRFIGKLLRAEWSNEPFRSSAKNTCFRRASTDYPREKTSKRAHFHIFSIKL